MHLTARSKWLFVLPVILNIVSPRLAFPGCAPVPGGAVAWWQLDGDARDKISSNHGTVSPDVTMVPGKVGLGAKFQGQGGIEVPDNKELNFGAGVNFSIEGWLFAEYASTPFGNMTILDKRVSPNISSALGFEFFLMEGRLALQLSDNLNEGFYTVGGAGPDVRGAWHHIAVTVDRSSSSGGIFYVDGQPVGTFDATIENGDLSTLGPVLIGQHRNYPEYNANFHGIIDELTVYRAALTAQDVESLYLADSGKCTTPVPPWVLPESQSRTVFEGQTVAFNVLAFGTPPLSYQWYLNSTNLLQGETNRSLVVANVLEQHAGSYSVSITNPYGETNIPIATLSVLPAGSCCPVPDGLVAWWKGEGSPSDAYSTNHGTLVGDTQYGSGASGAAFQFDGFGDAVLVGNPEALHVQNFTIEAWVKRSSAALITGAAGYLGMIFSFGTGGYGLYLDRFGVPTLTHVGYSAIAPSASITNTLFHHVAVTKQNSQIVFYLDGQAYPVGPYEPAFEFSTDAQIGAHGMQQADCFLGIIDELSIYSRPLSAGELQLIYQSGAVGKCTSPAPPVVRLQPTDQSIFSTQSAEFKVIAAGSTPLTYQWYFGQDPIPGAEGPELRLTKVLAEQAGSYWVRVTNSVGATESNPAVLAVKPLPPCVAPDEALVSCWRGEGNGWDERSGNNGTPYGDLSYAPGLAASAFVLDGYEDSLLVGNPSSLHLQDFTIEMWLRRANANQVSEFGGPGMLFAYGLGGYGFYLDSSGRPCVTKVGSLSVGAATNITDTAFHHVAVTKTGSNVVFFVDGLAHPAAVPFDPGFIFTSDARIGASADGYGGAFQGMIDELSVFSRALNLEEVRAIFEANAAGKCFAPTTPQILKQPLGLVLPASSNAVFRVQAIGSAFLSFQWYHNGAPLEGGNQSYLALPNITSAAAGTYSVTVSNHLGSVTSSNAELRVIVFTKVLNDKFDAGISSTAWAAFGSTVLATNYGGYMYSSPSSLWFGGDGPRWAVTAPVDTTLGGYVEFGLAYGSRLTPGFWDRVEFPDKIVVLEYQAGTATNWNEMLRCSYASSYWRRYSQNIPEDARTENTRFRWRQLIHDGGAYDHWAIDDMAVFLGPSKPVFAVQPGDQQAVVGTNLRLAATANGTTPLTYAWLFNDQPIPGADQETLQIPNAQFSHSGTYTLMVSNSAGTALSMPAVVNVTYPPALFSIDDTSAASGQLIQLPLSFNANGDENAFGFSLHFPPALLRLQEIQLSALCSNGIVLLNTNALADGRIGVGVSLPADSTFASGTQEIASLSFSTAILTEPATAEVVFADVPVVRQLANPTGHKLPVIFQPGSINIAPGVFEADIMPRPDGDHNVTITDWVRLGRYAALLETPADPAEFQRADCAPRLDLGDGAITLIDWVQAGRYAVQLDDLTLVGGPLAPPTGPGVGLGGPVRNGDPTRQLEIGSVEVVPGTEAQLQVTLTAEGNENGAAFSLSFDPSLLEYGKIDLGPDAKGATLYLNDSQAASGRIAVVLALAPGQVFRPGNQTIALVSLAPKAVPTAPAIVSFIDVPVKREISEVSALPLVCEYVNGAVSVVKPRLSIALFPEQLVLSWPDWGTNLLLQSTLNLQDASSWQNVTNPPSLNDGKLTITVSQPSQPSFFRLISAR